MSHDSAISEASVVMIRDNLRDFGNSMLWAEIDNDDIAANIFKTIKANIGQDHLAFYVIDNALRSLNRIAVYEKNGKGKIVDLKFSPSAIQYV